MKQTFLHAWNIFRKTIAIITLMFCVFMFIKGSQKSIDGAFFLSLFAIIIGFGGTQNKKNTHQFCDPNQGFPAYYKVGSSEWNMRQPLPHSYTNRF